VGSIVQNLEESFTQARRDANAPPDRSDWETFVRKDNPVQGTSQAKVTIVMFIDFECPYCQASFPVMKELSDTFGDAVRIVFKNYPIQSIHPNARAAAHAGMCAHAQGKFWNFYDRAFIYKNLDESKLYEYAVESGVNAALFDQCYRAQTYTKVIDQDLEDGLILGVRGTPTYMVNGKFIEGVHSLDHWKTVLIEMLNTPLP